MNCRQSEIFCKYLFPYIDQLRKIKIEIKIKMKLKKIERYLSK